MKVIGTMLLAGSIGAVIGIIIPPPASYLMSLAVGLATFR